MEYQIKLNDQELNIVGKALGSMPYGEVAPLIQKMVDQIGSQKDKEIDAPRTESEKVE